MTSQKIMPIPATTDDELRKVHAALRITVPFEQLPPLMRHSLAMVAHCWRGRVPAHLFGRPAAKQKDQAQPGKQPVNDFKRRASGDFD
ncbi:hypothetical protein [Undibacterium sp.]|uniref:hypothetical protein n=1 Tax=Undibacterium sp. TaxID=1914977 RepID=UPI002730BA28|nr:hypothetical protein [Undibacterium sp.]MDP1979232.1 hypothetical protein [Undibacterium sp.]